MVSKKNQQNKKNQSDYSNYQFMYIVYFFGRGEKANHKGYVCLGSLFDKSSNKLRYKIAFCSPKTTFDKKYYRSMLAEKLQDGKGCHLIEVPSYIKPKSVLPLIGFRFMDNPNEYNVPTWVHKGTPSVGLKYDWMTGKQGAVLVNMMNILRRNKFVMNGRPITKSSFNDFCDSISLNTKTMKGII